MKISRIIILMGLIVLGIGFTGYASDVMKESRWDSADLGGPSASKAQSQSRWDSAELGGPSAAQAQTQNEIGGVVISLYGKDGNLIARWDAVDLGGPSASKAQTQSRWDSAELGGPSASKAQPQSRWDSADLGGPSASKAQTQSRWDSAELGGPSASRAQPQSRWDSADLGGPSASKAQTQSRWDSAELGGPSASRAQPQSRWDSADLGGPSATKAQDPVQQGTWDQQYRVWKRTPRLEIVNKNYDRDQIGNGLVDIMGIEGVKFYFQDYNYVPVRFEWLQQYVQWWNQAKENFGIAYANDAFDCENYARLFKAMLDVQIVPIQRKVSKSLATAVVLVSPKNEFGGVGPESGTHVLNLVGTDRGWIIVEPQTGAMVEFSRYPNLKYIIGLAFG